MCGIIGGVGKLAYTEVLYKGLSSLEYRGYDSTGVVYWSNSQVKCLKSLGTVDNLFSKLGDFSCDGFLSHTRWATHGEVSIENAHPQISNDNNLYLAHNGIIENASLLKEDLLKKGYIFSSSTDTEVIVGLLQSLLSDGLDTLEALDGLLNVLKGEFAFAFIDKRHKGSIYFCRKGTPLLIGQSKGGMLISSDLMSIGPFIDKYVDLHDGEYGLIDEDGVDIYLNGKRVKPDFKKVKIDLVKPTLNNYAHFLLKEIEEMPKAIESIIDTYCPRGEIELNVALALTLKNARSIELIGSGSSFNAAKIGSAYFSKMGIEIPAYIASERPFVNKGFDKSTLYVLISQSGESADLISLQNKIHLMGGEALVITNNRYSSLARNSDYLLDIKAGLEVAVPASKSFIGTCCLLLILAFCLGKRSGIKDELLSLIKGIKELSSQKEDIKNLVDKYKNIRDAYLIGRGDEYLACLEGALKLKEVALVHAEAIAGGELKHGPLALLDSSSLVIGLLLESESESLNRLNLAEASSRGASTLIISSSYLSKEGDDFLLPSIGRYTKILLGVSWLMYFAYYLGIAKGIKVDRPANLAKSVTSK